MKEKESGCGCLWPVFSVVTWTVFYWLLFITSANINGEPFPWGALPLSLAWALVSHNGVERMNRSADSVP